MSTSNLITAALILPAILLFWTLSSTTSSPFANSFPNLRNKRICLLIAHPDDEAMFFAPTVLALTKPELGNHLKILCFSTGDADGLGSLRKKELQKSAKHLGLRSESDVFVVDDPSRFPDSMTKTWSETDISTLLSSAFTPDLSPTSRQNGTAKTKTNPKPTPPFATIDILLTFDKAGISNHPNHRSLYHGARHFLRQLMKDKPGYTCPVTLYTLSTTFLLRKYAGVLDAPVTMIVGAVSNLRATIPVPWIGSGSGPASGADGSKRRTKDDPVNRLLFISSVREWLKAQSAMVDCHKSQMVWFRWGWISMGRYMAVNDLKRERVV